MICESVSMTTKTWYRILALFILFVIISSFLFDDFPFMLEHRLIMCYVLYCSAYILESLVWISMIEDCVRLFGSIVFICYFLFILMGMELMTRTYDLWPC